MPSPWRVQVSSSPPSPLLSLLSPYWYSLPHCLCCLPTDWSSLQRRQLCMKGSPLHWLIDWKNTSSSPPLCWKSGSLKFWAGCRNGWKNSPVCPVLTPGSDGGDVGELEEGGKMGVGKEEVRESKWKSDGWEEGGGGKKYTLCCKGDWSILSFGSLWLICKIYTCSYRYAVYEEVHTQCTCRWHCCRKGAWPSSSYLTHNRPFLSRCAPKLQLHMLYTYVCNYASLLCAWQ